MVHKVFRMLTLSLAITTAQRKGFGICLKRESDNNGLPAARPVGFGVKHVIILGALTLACHLSLASFALEVVDPMVGSEQTPFGERRVSGPADGCPHGRAVTSIPYLVKVPNATERRDCVGYGFCFSRQIYERLVLRATIV